MTKLTLSNKMAINMAKFNFYFSLIFFYMYIHFTIGPCFAKRASSVSRWARNLSKMRCDDILGQSILSVRMPKSDGVGTICLWDVMLCRCLHYRHSLQQNKKATKDESTRRSWRHFASWKKLGRAASNRKKYFIWSKKLQLVNNDNISAFKLYRL